MLSFVVPAFNEERELSASLEATRAAAESAAHPFEIIVVDDASTDATADIARRAGAHVISVNFRQIAAVRNAGGRAAVGDVLFFVDADTHILPSHVTEALAAVAAGSAGGGARVKVAGPIPLWARFYIRMFCAIYFGLNFGAGAFLFTTRRNFLAIGGFEEEFFAGEEVYFTMALKKIGRFQLLHDPVTTSGRKLRMHSARTVLGQSLAILVGGERSLRSRTKLDLWYDGKREERAA